VLYPFVRGDNAKRDGLTATQWREFGLALRAVHDSGLEDDFRDRLRSEDFALPSAELVRRMHALVASDPAFASPAARRFAAFWREHAERIDRMLARAEALGRSLQEKPLPRVLCHGDIHAANILVGEDERIWLIDWDGPLIAPRERDLQFVAGCRIARIVTPAEEDDFFASYGPTTIDREALIYYRYERIIEDLGEIGKSVFVDPEIGEAVRADEADLAMKMFAPDDDLDHAEQVARTRWPNRL
jgi:spectinomycin phosphotransferase